MSRNMCKLRHKVGNDQNLPHGSLNFRSFFFPSNFSDNLGREEEKKFKFFFSFFSSLDFRRFKTCVNCVRNCRKPKRASVRLLHDQMMLDLAVFEVFPFIYPQVPTFHLVGALTSQYLDYQDLTEVLSVPFILF